MLITHLWLAALVLEKVKITPKHVRVLVGDTLYLNCSGQTTFNGRISFTWDFPRIRVSVDAAFLCVSSLSADLSHLLSFLQDNQHYVIKRKGDTSVELLMSNTLVLPNITMGDKGLYHCNADLISQTHMNASANVSVFSKYPVVAAEAQDKS